MVAGLIGGCAGGPALTGSAGTFSQTGGYTLSEDEKKLDCKRLRGRMQIRIVQVRAVRDRVPTSTTSRALQQSLNPVYGGSTYGADPANDLKRDMAQIEAFNRRLAELKCPTVDLQQELAAKSSQ